jgi:predicted site-specific integrase-resolvase
LVRKAEYNHDETPVDRQAWRVREYCEAHRISNSTFWKYVGLGKIRVIRIGGRVLVPATEAARIASEGLR